MPTYEYRCRSCGTTWEQVQNIRDSELTECPACPTGPVERLISRTSFALVGRGWARDGYSK